MELGSYSRHHFVLFLGVGLLIGAQADLECMILLTASFFFLLNCARNGSRGFAPTNLHTWPLLAQLSHNVK